MSTTLAMPTSTLSWRWGRKPESSAVDASSCRARRRRSGRCPRRPVTAEREPVLPSEGDRDAGQDAALLVLDRAGDGADEGLGRDGERGDQEEERQDQDLAHGLLSLPLRRAHAVVAEGVHRVAEAAGQERQGDDALRRLEEGLVPGRDRGRRGRLDRPESPGPPGRAPPREPTRPSRSRRRRAGPAPGAAAKAGGRDERRARRRAPGLPRGAWRASSSASLHPSCRPRSGRPCESRDRRHQVRQKHRQQQPMCQGSIVRTGALQIERNVRSSAGAGLQRPEMRGARNGCTRSRLSSATVFRFRGNG